MRWDILICREAFAAARTCAAVATEDSKQWQAHDRNKAMSSCSQQLHSCKTLLAAVLGRPSYYMQTPSNSGVRQLAVPKTTARQSIQNNISGYGYCEHENRKFGQ